MTHKNRTEHEPCRVVRFQCQSICTQQQHRPHMHSVLRVFCFVFRFLFVCVVMTCGSRACACGRACNVTGEWDERMVRRQRRRRRGQRWSRAGVTHQRRQPRQPAAALCRMCVNKCAPCDSCCECVTHQTAHTHRYTPKHTQNTGSIKT